MKVYTFKHGPNEDAFTFIKSASQEEAEATFIASVGDTPYEVSSSMDVEGEEAPAAGDTTPPAGDTTPPADDTGDTTQDTP